MNKKNCQHEITQTNHWEIGRYTIVEVIDASGIKAVGLARKSQHDKHYSKDLALKIANGRALKALTLKKEKKTVYHSLMG